MNRCIYSPQNVGGGYMEFIQKKFVFHLVALLIVWLSEIGSVALLVQGMAN